MGQHKSESDKEKRKKKTIKCLMKIQMGDQIKMV